MKLIIFGATGTVGRHLVDQALSQNHRVTAFARKPSVLKLDHPNLTRRAGLFLCAGIFLVFGYFVALAAGISLAASHYEIRWEYVAGGVAAGHLALGIIAFLTARARFSKPLFEHTLKELEKDRQWLQDRKQL